MKRSMMLLIGPLALILPGCTDQPSNTAAATANAAQAVAGPEEANDMAEMNDTMADMSDNMSMSSDWMGAGDAAMPSAQPPDGNFNGKDM